MTTSRKQPKKTTTEPESKEEEFEYPPPMEPLYGSRVLLKPWRRNNELAPNAGETPTAVVWTHLEQNMFDLQVSASESGTHPRKAPFNENPYPQ